jgi:hypothetical protein
MLVLKEATLSYPDTYPPGNASICKYPEAENPLVIKYKTVYMMTTIPETFHFKYNIREKVRTTC